MPTGRMAEQFLDRMARLEERVENLMTFQKWQMTILGGIVVAVISLWVK